MCQRYVNYIMCLSSRYIYIFCSYYEIVCDVFYIFRIMKQAQIMKIKMYVRSLYWICKVELYVNVVIVIMFFMCIG